LKSIDRLESGRYDSLHPFSLYVPLTLILFDLYTPFNKLCCKNATCLLVEVVEIERLAVHAPANTTALTASNIIFQANLNAIDNNGGKLHSKALAQEILLITHG
jgi:hypothetical protein